MRATGRRSRLLQNMIRVDGQPVRRHAFRHHSQPRHALTAQSLEFVDEHLIRGIEQICQQVHRDGIAVLAATGARHLHSPDQPQAGG